MRVPRRLVALALVAALLVLAAPRPARAGGGADAVLALAAFAVFANLFLPPVVVAERTTIVYASPAYPPPIYTAVGPTAVHTPPVAVPAAPAPPPRAVEYPHGRWELRGDGVSLAYHWVWIPKAPPPPPPVPPPPPGPPPAAPPAR